MGMAAATVMSAPQVMATVNPWTVPAAAVADWCAAR
jgi:hypothetical protein